jgi:hypothetical protein
LAGITGLGKFLLSLYVADRWLTEIGTARIISDSDSNKFFIPIIFDNIDIPPVIQDIFCLQASRQEIKSIIGKIDKTLIDFYNEKEREKAKVQEIQQRFETNVDKYVGEVIKALAERELTNKRSGQVWYVLGYLALIAGVGFCIIGFLNLADKLFEDYGVIVLLSLKSLMIIGLLIALSKYAFNLGKSYTNESLKNADRIHAISFGEFYLKTFKERVNYSEMKEVFQHWNINNDSYFSKLDSKDFDPKILENIIELAKLLSNPKN